jgi:uncharacterized membrane protein
MTASAPSIAARLVANSYGDVDREETGMEATAAKTQPPQAGPAPDPLRHHKHYQNPDGSPYAGGSNFMERLSGKVASGMGTPMFIVVSSVLIFGWVISNGLFAYISSTVKAVEHGKQFDPEPWILLNLVFSAVAFYTGALVIIAQKAQTRTDRANELAAARHRDEIDQRVSTLLQENTDLTTSIHAISEQIRTLTEQVHAATCGRPAPPT